MSDKNPQRPNSKKKPTKTLKEKRADKREKKGGGQIMP